MELLRALAALAERPGEAQVRVARSIGIPPPDAADYTAAFTSQLYPFASVYLGAEGMLGGEARERIAGFWRALGLEVPQEPDHLATLLALLAELTERAESVAAPARRDAMSHAARALFWEHVAPWAPLYASKMRNIGGPCYGAWAAVLGDALHETALRLGPEPALSAHLRAAPGVDDPREAGADAFIATLLAPLRSGTVIVRSDLERAARALDLGMRQGERRFALRALLAQDRISVLGWLASEAAESASRYRAAALPDGVRAFWCGQATRTAGLLSALRDQAEHAPLVPS